jgi:hypothetical protein
MVYDCNIDCPFRVTFVIVYVNSMMCLSTTVGYCTGMWGNRGPGKSRNHGHLVIHGHPSWPGSCTQGVRDLPRGKSRTLL